jgi:hypothetical protein
MDPASTQFQQDIAEVHNHMGELLFRSGDFNNAITELKKSLVVVDRISTTKNPHVELGQLVLSDQYWLGKANAGLGLANGGSRKAREEYFREALSWFDKCLPGYRALAQDPSGYDGPDRVPDIQRTIERCKSSK